jgi:predicted DCC family thiol-disulfide oxidoreductase YuxK
MTAVPQTQAEPAKTDIPLPSPAERPEADIVIFDGQCKFCTGQVQNLARWDRKGRLAYLSLHDPQVAKRFPDLTYEQLMEEMVVVDQQGRRHAGAAAFKYLTTRLPGLYLLAPLLHIPFTMPLWRWGYRQIAKRRYALAGKTAAACDDGGCKVHFK